MFLVQGLCQSALEISQILCFLVLGCIESLGPVHMSAIANVRLLKPQ